MKTLLLILLSVLPGFIGVPIWEQDPEYDKFIELQFTLSTAEHSIHFAEIGKRLPEWGNYLC